MPSGPGKRSDWSFTPILLQQQTNKFIKLMHSKGTAIAGFTQSTFSPMHINPNCYRLIQQLFDSLYQSPDDSTTKNGLDFPSNTLAFSIACYNFHVCSKSHEFEPDPECKPPNAVWHWSHRMLTKELQAAYYTQNSIEYLAGLTYYTCNIKDKFDPEFILNLFNFAIKSSEPFPLKCFEESWIKQKYNVYGRYCSKAGKRVIVDCGITPAKHSEFNYRNGSLLTRRCKECRMDAVINERYFEEQSHKTFDNAGAAGSSENADITADPICFENFSNIPPRPLSPDELARDIIDLAASNIREHNPSILVFNKETGKLLDESEWPKIHDLSHFLDCNPECNVHVNSTFLVQVSIGKDWRKDRIGDGLSSSKVEEVKEECVERDLIDWNTPREGPSNSVFAVPRYLDVDSTIQKFEDLWLSDVDLEDPTSPIPNLPHTESPSSSSCACLDEENQEEVTDC